MVLVTHDVRGCESCDALYPGGNTCIERCTVMHVPAAALVESKSSPALFTLEGIYKTLILGVCCI